MPSDSGTFEVQSARNSDRPATLGQEPGDFGTEYPRSVLAPRPSYPPAGYAPAGYPPGVYPPAGYPPVDYATPVGVVPSAPPWSASRTLLAVVAAVVISVMGAVVVAAVDKAPTTTQGGNGFRIPGNGGGLFGNGQVGNGQVGNGQVG